GIGGGFVGVAAGIDIGVLDVTVQTVIGTGATLRAADDVSVLALSRKNVQTYALSVGGGFVGAAGAVSVWSVGTQATTTYDDDGGGESKGEWASVTIYGKGDVVTFGGKKYFATATTDDLRKNDSPTANTQDWDPVQTKEPLKTNKGPWTSGKKYAQDDVVTFGGQKYVVVTEGGVADARVNQDPTVNTTDWHSVAAGQGGGDAVSDSDDAAKGDGGYKDAVNGASVREVGNWVSGTAYIQGDVVVYLGKKYVARKTIENTSAAPSDNTVSAAYPDGEWNVYTA